MKRPQVSIIVTIYNKSMHLKKCIESLTNQTLTNIEIILVNDGSTDSSLEICNAYHSRDKRIRIVDKKNEGVVKARIDGVREAHGEYVSIIDADDWADHNYYEKAYCKAKENDADIIVTGYTENHIDKTIPIKMSVPDGLYLKNDKDNSLLNNMIYNGSYYHAGINPSLWNKLIKNDSLLQEVRNVDLSIQLGEDGAALYPMMAKAGCIIVDNDNQAYHYRIEEGTLSRQFDKRQLSKTLILLNYLRTRLGELSELDFTLQLDYYSVFMITLGVRKCILNKAYLNPVRKAKILEYGLKEYKRADLCRFSELADIPAEEKRIIGNLSKGQYLQTVCLIYIKTLKKRFGMESIKET